MREIQSCSKLFHSLFPKQEISYGVMYVPSQFVLRCTIEGKDFAYNLLTKQCYEATLPSNCVAHSGYDLLIENYFLVPENKDECKFYEDYSRIIRTLYTKKGYSGFTILPTLKCNARCVYCYEEGMQQMTMSDEIIDQTIKFICDNRRNDTVPIQWFGGEPLLGIYIIDRICQGLSLLDIKYKSSMITNGSMIDASIVDKMKHEWNLDHIQLSMDGNEADYVSRKRYYSYHDYYHRVIDSVNLLCDAGIRVSIRSNIDQHNCDTINEFLHDLGERIVNKSAVNVYFSPLYVNRERNQGLSLWETAIQGKDAAKSLGFRVSSTFGLKKDLKAFHCMADGGGVVIGPDGSLYPCEHCLPDSRYGNVFDGITDYSALKRWTTIGMTRDKCRKCTFLPQCTSYSMCPVSDVHCKEAHLYDAIGEIGRLVNDSIMMNTGDSSSNTDIVSIQSC